MSTNKHDNRKRTHYIYQLLRDADASPDKAGKIGCTQSVQKRMNQHFRGTKQEGVEWKILKVLPNTTRKQAEQVELQIQEEYNVVDGYNNMEGENNPNYGKKHSQDSIIKMKQAQSEWNKAHRWYNNGSKNLFCIPGEQPEGYNRGRIMKRNDKGMFL